MTFQQLVQMKDEFIGGEVHNNYVNPRKLNDLEGYITDITLNKDNLLSVHYTDLEGNRNGFGGIEEVTSMSQTPNWVSITIRYCGSYRIYKKVQNYVL